MVDGQAPQGGDRLPLAGRLLTLAVVGALGAIVVPAGAQVLRSECNYQIAAEANEASNQGRPPGDPGLACDFAGFLGLR